MQQITTLKSNFLDVILSEAAKGKSLRIISPFIGYSVIDRIVSALPNVKLQVITRYNLQDFYDRVSDIGALRRLLDSKAEIKGIRRLHTKLYLFDNGKVILSSANLTMGGMCKNHEFGVLINDSDAFKECESYFNYLWDNSKSALTQDMLDNWEDEIFKLKNSSKSRKPSPLGDMGDDLKMDGKKGENTDIQNRVQYFVKFFGVSTDRVEPDFSVYEEIERSECHYAVCYPNGKPDKPIRPRQVQDGDVIFMARMINPNDYAVFGVARALKHQEGRDDASKKEIKRLNEKCSFKERWGRYVRIYDPIFIDGKMKDCPSLSKMMDKLKYKSFVPTYENYLKNDKTKNIEPRSSLSQKAGIQITDIAAEWLFREFQEKLDLQGAVPKSKLNELPSSKNIKKYLPSSDNISFYPEIKRQSQK